MEILGYLAVGSLGGVVSVCLMLAVAVYFEKGNDYDR